MGVKFKDKANRPIFYKVTIGVLIFITLSLILSGLLSTLVLNERIKETMITPVILGVTAISTFSGSIVAVKDAKDKYALITGVMAFVYCFALIAGGVLLFESGFQNIWKDLLAIVIGNIFACVIALRQSSGKRKKRRNPR